jgi:hypothetical protein
LTEQMLEITGVVDAALRPIDIRPTVVGGLAVAYWTTGLYLTGDIDVVMPHSAEIEQRLEALGFERALASFVDDCLHRSNCPLSGDRASALAQVSGILDAADRTPLRASRPVTQSLALLGMAYSMYDPALWVVLRQALAQAVNGQGSVLLLLADFYLQRNSKGHYTSNSNDALYAVTCLDRPETSDLAALRARAKGLSAVAPRFGAYVLPSSAATISADASVRT